MNNFGQINEGLVHIAEFPITEFFRHRSKFNAKWAREWLPIHISRPKTLRFRFFNRHRFCVCCGIEGTRLLLDLINNNSVAQFNLWAEENGKLVLMTIDHITPLSKGGNKRDGNNLQVMCIHCNRLKGNRLIKNGKLRKEVDNLKKYGIVKV